MPYVRIAIVRDVLQSDPTGKKAAISAKVAGAIAEATGLPEHEISIVFDEVDARNWYVGRTDVATMRFSTWSIGPDSGGRVRSGADASAKR